MATGKVSIKRPAVAPPPADEVTDVEPISETADDLQVMMAELAGTSSSKVTVYRIVKGQPLAYVFATTPDAFSLDTLRDKYNGGEFRLFISKDGQLWKNRTVNVEPRQVGSAGEVAPTETAAVAALLREGFDKQAQMMAQVVRTLATPPAPPPSPFANMDIPAILTALAAFLPALRQPAPPPVVAPQGINPDRAIDMMMKGFELAREMKDAGGGGDGGEPSLMGVLRDLIKSPMLAQAIAASAQPPAAAPAQPRLQQPRPAAPPQPAPQPATAPSFAGATPPPTPQQPENDMNFMMKQYLGMLVHHAAAGSDPSLYADLILDNLDEPTLHALLNRQPTPVDALIADHPPIAEHREWFEALVSEVAQALQDEAQSPMNEPGVIDNAAGNATPAIPGGTPAG